MNMHSSTNFFSCLHMVAVIVLPNTSSIQFLKKDKTLKAKKSTKTDSQLDFTITVTRTILDPQIYCNNFHF